MVNKANEEYNPAFGRVKECCGQKAQITLNPISPMNVQRHNQRIATVSASHDRQWVKVVKEEQI
jgi:hypothetical protein